MVFATLAVAAQAQYYIADTPEVQAAKAEFAKAWNAAAARNAQPVAPIAYEQQRSLAFAPAAAPVVPVANALNFEDGETWPEAEPYVHVEIPAEPYVHIEGDAAPAAEPYVAPVQAAPVQAAPVQYAQAPVQYAQAPVYAQYAQAPVYAQYAQAPVYAQAPAAPVAAPTGCFNWKGESVQCRY